MSSRFTDEVDTKCQARNKVSEGEDGVRRLSAESKMPFVSPERRDLAWGKYGHESSIYLIELHVNTYMFYYLYSTV